MARGAARLGGDLTVSTYPDAWPVEHALDVTLDAGGAASAVLTVPGAQTWRVLRLAATGTSQAPGILRVFRNGTLVDSTRYAIGDVSEVDNLTLFAGEQLRADWTQGTAGAAMRLTVTAEAVR
jgi:hypothetical protein